jgi:hypothetical protein
MARRPKPWYWKARRSWFVTLNGKRHNLGPDKAAAFDKLHQLLAQPAKQVVRSDSVLVVIDAFLEWCSNHRAPDTFEWYQFRLQRFAETYPHLKVDQLRPYHVQKWLDSMNGLSSGSKRNSCRAIKRTMKWAAQQGYIDQSPIAHLEQPKTGKREIVVSQQEFDRILDLAENPHLRDLLVTTWESVRQQTQTTRPTKEKVTHDACRVS